MGIKIPSTVLGGAGLPPGGGRGAAPADGKVKWITADLSAGTVYGNSLIVTSRTATSLTIDPGQNAAAFLDNSPDNRSDYWWASVAVDLTAWDPSTPALLLIDVTRADAAASHGTLIGGCFHNTADPTLATAYSGVWIRRKTNGDGDGWAINHMAQLGGFSSPWANRQRATMVMLLDGARLEALNYRSRFLDKTGNSIVDAQTIVSSATPSAFDVTGGLWFSVLAGSYQPNGPADAASAHTPSAVRYAVVPFGTVL